MCRVCRTASIHLTGDCRRHSTAQGSNSGHCDLLVAVLVGAGVSGSDHVGLEQCTLQVDVMVRQGLVDSSQHLLGNVLAAFQIMVTIRKNLRFHDGDNAVLKTTQSNVKYESAAENRQINAGKNRSHNCLPSGKCWHSGPGHWRSPRWPVLKE